jgi:hypothetical protein
MRPSTRNQPAGSAEPQWAARDGGTPLVGLQPGCSLTPRWIEEEDVPPACERHGLEPPVVEQPSDASR